MSVRICLDVGFSGVKIATLTDGQLKYEKEQNSVCDLGSENYEAYSGKEKNIVAFGGHHYLVGKSALQMEDTKIQKIEDYETMKLITPIVATKYLRNYNPEDVEYICFTLSEAYLKKSKDFHQALTSSLPEYSGKIRLIPQGAGIKKAIDNVGLDVDNPSHKDSYKNYIIIDGGFNTIDVAKVVDNELVPGNIKGHEQKGAILIAKEVQRQIKSKFDIDLNMDRVKGVLEDKSFKQRSDVYDCKEIVKLSVEYYLGVLRDFLEANYGEEMNAIQHVLLCGGIAEIIRENTDQWKSYFGEGFMIMPVSKGSSTFYNAIGGLYIK